MQETAVIHACKDPGFDEIVMLMLCIARDYSPLIVKEILLEAEKKYGRRDWIYAGLGCFDTGHGDLAASLALSDFYTTIEVIYNRD
jgi:hypothetical protein